MSRNSVQVTFGANIQPLIDGVNAIKGQIETLRGSIEAMVAAFAVERIAGFVSSMAESAVKVQETARAFGLTAQQVQLFGVAEALVGEQNGNLIRDFAVLSKNIEAAANPTSRQAQALRALGLSQQALLNMPTEEAFERVSAAIEKYHGGMTKGAQVSVLFGRNLQEMLPLIEQAAHHFEEANEVGQRTGAVFSDAMIAKFADLYKLIAELGLAFKGLGGTLLDVFGGAAAGLVKILNDVVEGFTRAIKEGGSLHPILLTLGAAVELVDAALAVAIGVVEAFWDICKEAAEQIASIWNGVGRIMYDAFTFNWSDISAAWGDFQKNMAAHGKELADNLAGDVKRAVDEIKVAFGLVGAGPEGKDNRPGAPGFSGGNDANKAAMERAQAAIKAADESYKATQQQLAAEYKLHEITYGEETQALMAALNTRYSAEMAALTQEEGLYAQGSAAWQKVVDEEMAKYQAYIDAKRNLEEKAAEQSQKDWEAAIKPIESAWNSQLRGLLSGTETWAQAMHKMAADLVIQIIEEFEKIAVITPMINALKNSFDIGDLAATITKMITGFIGPIFAGMTANLSPKLGPAAVPVAAGIAAGVEGIAAGMSKLDVGGTLLTDGVYYGHAGETVVPPAAQVQMPYQGSGSGGGGSSGGGITHNWTITGPIIGTQQWLEQMKNQLAKAVNSSNAMNPSTSF